MLLDIFDVLFILPYIFVYFIFSDLSSLVGCWSPVSDSIRRIIYNLLNVCPFDYTAFVVSGKVRNPFTGLITPVGKLLLLQLTVIRRPAIVV